MKFSRALLLPFLFSPYLVSQIGLRNSDNQTVEIRGDVRDTSGKSIENVRVQVQDAGTGSTLASAYTNDQGFFELPNLRSGSYEIIAYLGTSEVRQRIDTHLADNNIELRFPAGANASSETGSATVSVADYKVPKNARKAYEHASSALAKHDLAQTDKYLEEALHIYPEYADALTLRAIRSLDQKNADAAITDLDAAVKADKNNARAYLVLASAFNFSNRYDDALRALDRASTLAPNAWQGYFEMAKAHLGKAQYEAALRWITRAQQFAPKSYASVYLTKINVLLGMKDYPAATQELQAFLVSDPNGPMAGQARAMLEQVKRLH